jgi:hypothetical protein
MERLIYLTAIFVLTIVLASIACAETPATQPAQPTSTNAVSASVLKVVGHVQYSPIDSDNWKDLHEGDTLTDGTRIRTGFKSAVQLQLHTAAIVQIQSATQVALTELAKYENTEKTRIGLKYGKIRGGIIQEKVNSDFQIVCPVAVLTREGTWGFEMSYDPATENFYVGLDTDGLVRVLQTSTGRRMGILPGQHVTQSMQAWFKTAQFEDMVDLVDQFGTTTVEKLFYASNSGGLTAADPTGTSFASTFKQGLVALWNKIILQQQTQDKTEQLQNSQTLQSLVRTMLSASGNSSRKNAASAKKFRLVSRYKIDAKK